MLGGQLYAAGGHDGPLVRKSVEVYNPQINTWRLVSDMNMCRRNAGNKILLLLRLLLLLQIITDLFQRREKMIYHIQ